MLPVLGPKCRSSLSVLCKSQNFFSWLFLKDWYHLSIRLINTAKLKFVSQLLAQLQKATHQPRSLLTQTCVCVTFCSLWQVTAGKVVLTKQQMCFLSNSRKSPWKLCIYPQISHFYGLKDQLLWRDGAVRHQQEAQPQRDVTQPLRRSPAAAAGWRKEEGQPAHSQEVQWWPMAHGEITHPGRLCDDTWALTVALNSVVQRLLVAYYVLDTYLRKPQLHTLDTFYECVLVDEHEFEDMKIQKGIFLLKMLETRWTSELLASGRGSGMLNGFNNPRG